MKQLLLPLTLLILTMGCKNAGNHSQVGQYIYSDYNDVLHIDFDCPQLNPHKRFNKPDSYSIIPIDTAELVCNNEQKFCTRCINQDNFIKLSNISDSNRDKISIRHQRLKSLRNSLLLFDYTPPSLDSFIEDMHDEDNLFRVYQTLKREKMKGLQHDFESFKAYYLNLES